MKRQLPDDPPRGTWRTLSGADLPSVQAIAAVRYPDHPESPAVFSDRMAVYSSGCLALDLNGAVEGYVLSHPARYGHPPKLDIVLGKIPDGADCYYIHDLALAERASGRGHARECVELLAELAVAAGFDRMALVAVNDTSVFWQGMGFARDSDPVLASKLASYGSDSAYMVRHLA